MAGGIVVGGLGGAVLALTNALPADTVAELEAALAAALANRNLSRELAERILIRSGAEEGRGQVNLGTVEIAETDTVPYYARFAAEGVTTVLEIGIAQVALSREDQVKRRFPF